MGYNYRDRDWLFEQYVTAKRTTVSMAEECNVSNSTVIRWMDKNEIPRRSVSEALLINGLRRSVG